MRASGPYSAWVAWLDAFGRGQDLPAGHLPPIGEDMGPHMRERLLSHLVEAFSRRQRRWVDALVRDRELLAVDPARATMAIAAMLAAARARLAPLYALTENGLLGAEVRANLADALKETVGSAQQTLEDSVRDAPVDLQAAIRMNSLLSASTRSRPAVQPVAGQGPGRRVIL